MNEINPQLLKEIRENPKIRRRVAFASPLWFSLHYLRHHFTHPLAPFHIELFHILAQPIYEFIAIMAFRESGKSTIMNTANVLWSILGKPEKKFVLIVSKTQEQAKNHFANIKAELENNELLKNDFGPFMEQKDEWNKLSLELEYHGAKIMSVTKEQSVRGMKHGQYRPDLIICDDLEDIASGANQAESETLYRWFSSEIVPLGSTGTRIVVLGNLLAKESFLLRLKDDIEHGRILCLFRAYPLMDDEKRVLWPSKFPDVQSIESLLARLSEETWAREYLLDISGQSDWHRRRKYSLDDPIDRLSYEFALKVEMLQRKHRRYLIQNGTIVLQSPLIAPMQEFLIEAPSRKQLVALSNRESAGYQKYAEEQRAANKEFEDGLKKAIVKQVRKK